jgi:hypothetical protein
MNPERALRFSSILLAAAGFSGLVLSGELPVGLVLVGGAAILLSLAQVSRTEEQARGRQPVQISRRTWNVLIVVAFAGFLADLFWISQDLLQAGIHFLILLMVNKLFNLQQRKDFLHLYAISLLELLAAATLTVELWYAAVFIAYLLAAIWTLLLYHLRNEVDELRSSQQLRPPFSRTPGHRDPVHTPGPITSRFFWNTNGIAVGAFCLTLAIFFVMPRIGAGFFNKNRVERLRTSGFSEQVDLSVIGSIKLDQSVVMRVELTDRKGPVDERLYFRGAAYDQYNGRSWSNNLARRRVLARTPDGMFRVAGDGRKGPASQAGLRQEILLEALDTPALFGVSFVESVKGNFLIVQADGMGGLSLPYPLATRFQYSIVSIRNRLLEEEQAAASLTYPNQVNEYFLQLPALTTRVGDLAREVTRESGTPSEKVAAIERHLKESYAYSLDVGSAIPESPIEAFLFARKTGYCEHYATAMVIMLRTLGIPARLVTGFLASEWNDFGNYYTIRQRDAHAWVEVYFPHSGWVTFDPTPAVAAAAPNQAWMTASRILDSIQLKWDRFVIQYSFRDQMAVAQGVREQSDRVREQAWSMMASITRWTAAWRGRLGQWQWSADWTLVGGVAIGLSLVALVLAWWLGKLGISRRSRWFHSTGQAAIVRLYIRMLRLLESRGLSKAAGATPFEFARLVGREWADAGDVITRLTGLYCRVRFGQSPLTSEDVKLAESLLAGLRAARR